MATIRACPNGDWGLRGVDLARPVWFRSLDVAAQAALLSAAEAWTLHYAETRMVIGDPLKVADASIVRAKVVEDLPLTEAEQEWLSRRMAHGK